MERKEGKEGKKAGLRDLVPRDDTYWGEKLTTPVIENFEPDYGDPTKHVRDLSTRMVLDDGDLLLPGFSALPMDGPEFGVLTMAEVNAYFSAVRNAQLNAGFRGMAAYGAWEAYDRLEKAMPEERYVSEKRKKMRNKVLNLIAAKKKRALDTYVKRGESVLRDGDEKYIDCPADYGKIVNAIVKEYAPGLRSVLKEGGTVGKGHPVKIVVGKIPLDARHDAAGMYFRSSGVCLVGDKYFHDTGNFSYFGVDVILHELEHAARLISNTELDDTSTDEAETDLMTVSRRGPDARPGGYYAPFSKEERFHDVAEVYKEAGVMKEGQDPNLYVSKKFRKLPYMRQYEAVKRAFPRTFIRHMRKELGKITRADGAKLATTLNATTSEGDDCVIFFERPTEVTDELKKEIRDAVDRMDGEVGEERVVVRF